MFHERETDKYSQGKYKNTLNHKLCLFCTPSLNCSLKAYFYNLLYYFYYLYSLKTKIAFKRLIPGYRVLGAILKVALKTKQKLAVKNHVSLVNAGW